MCDDLKEELDGGYALAKQLVLHLQSMGANSCNIPVEVSEAGPDDGQIFEVIVRPKLN